MLCPCRWVRMAVAALVRGPVTMSLGAVGAAVSVSLRLRRGGGPRFWNLWAVVGGASATLPGGASLP